MDPSQAYFRERIQQYAAYAASLGMPCSVYELQAAARWDQHQQGLAEWLRSLEKPVGIFASSDQLGFWLLDAARRAGISVPEEVAVVGAENDQVLCETASPPLSSVAYPGKAVGYAAAQLLAEWMLGKKKKPPVPQILLPPLAQIATRQSSDIVAVEDPRISKALMFVRERAHTGIGVEDVARRVGMSRSALERAMRRAIGRSPGEEINRMRFSLVERLLVQTDLTLEAIAERVGFQHPQYMAEAFRKRTGETPGQFRQRRKS
jgi:LacI family transcriptional regulator